MQIQELQKIAREIRKDVVRMITTAGSGHSAGSLGSVELFTAFYFEILSHDPQTPNWDDRDRLMLSYGHVCPAQYAALSRAGYFDSKLLKTYGRMRSPLQGHPWRGWLPGVETSSGPLGSGLCQAAGVALGARMDNRHFRVFCLTSDGEHDSGNHWEGVMFAAKYKLSNLTLFVDRNNIQIDGTTDEVMPLNPLADKYKAFNWHVISIDGNNIEEIVGSVRQAREVCDRPTVVIAQTVPGKGVSFAENDYRWHGHAFSKEEAKKAIQEI